MNDETFIKESIRILSEKMIGVSDIVIYRDRLHQIMEHCNGRIFDKFGGKNSTKY